MMSGLETSKCQAVENNSNKEQVIQSMSVVVKKSCFDEWGISSLDEILKEIRKKQVEKKHVVHIENLANSHQLKGCFCGIKAVRADLQQFLKRKMEEKQNQGDIRNNAKQLEYKQTMLTETNEATRQTIDEKRPKTTTHSVPMDKDLYDYFIMDKLKPLCTSIKKCATETGFEVQIELNTEEDIETLKKAISLLQNRFVLKEYKVPDDIDYNEFKDAFTVIDSQKKEAVIVFDSKQKTAKVIGPAVEVYEIMDRILKWSANKHSDVSDDVTTNAIETVDERTHEYHNKRGTITDKTKRDQMKTLSDDTECLDRRGRAKDDSMRDNSKTVTDDVTQHPDKQDTTKDDNNCDKKAFIGEINSEHQHENINANVETGGDGKKTQSDTNIKSENPDKRSSATDETKEDDKETSTDHSESFSDKDGPYKHEVMGHDKKTLIYSIKSESPSATKDDTKGDDDKPLADDDTMPKRQGRRITANDEARGDAKEALSDNTKPDTYGSAKDEIDEDYQKTTGKKHNANKLHPDTNGTAKNDTMGHDKETLIDNTRSEYQDKQGPTTDNNRAGDVDKTLTDDTSTSKYPDIKGACKLDIQEINAKDTMVEHDSIGVTEEESTVKLCISQKGKEDDKTKEISLEEAVVKFSKAEDKSEYDNRSQGNQSPDAATVANNYTHQQPTKQRKLVHRISMDEDVYKYIQRFLHQELEEVTALCNYVQELRDETSKFDLGYTAKDEVNAETVRRRFQQLKDQVKIGEYKAPDMIYASVLESLVHASAKSERTMTFVQSEKNSLKIVGQPDKVDKLKKHIEETVSEQLQSHEQLSKENMYDKSKEISLSEQPFRQEYKAKVYYHLPIDKDLYTYISAHCRQEIERASKRCYSITSSQIGLTFTIDFELKDTKDEEFVKRIFKNLMGQFKSEQCRVPKLTDFAGSASFIQEVNTLREVMIFPQEDKQLLKLIGPSTQVSKTRKWIESLISDIIESEKPSNQKPNVANPNVRSTAITDQPRSNKELKPFVPTSIQRGNHVHSPRKPGEHFRITSITSDSFVYESNRLKNKLTVRVHFANIIKQKTDVLVSYEDEWLQSQTVLAIAMKEVDGPAVAQELSNIGKKHGRLEVGQVVHTSAGNLWPSVKYLVHAIRAQPSQHNPEDPNTFEILYKTFLNCLQYTNDNLYQKSISIPPIGSRKYGVEMVSAAFCKAVKEYDAIAEITSSLVSLHSIHFVDHDPAVVRHMITSIKSLIE